MLHRRAFLFTLATAATARAADWPRFLGPNHDLASGETSFEKQLPADGPPVLWQREKGAGHACPAVAGGKVILFHAEGDAEEMLCLAADTGTQLWHHRYRADYTPKFGAGPGPRANPVIADGRAFAHGINGHLLAADLATGKLLWQRELAREEDRAESFFGVGGTPLVSDGRLILPLGNAAQKSVVALDPATGKELWATRDPWAASYASPVPARLHGKDCILVLQGGMDDPPTGGLLVIEAATGKVLTRFPFRAKMFASVSISSPVVIGSRIFLAEAYTEGGVCVEIAPDFSAKVAWSAPDFGTYLNTAVAHEGHLYGFAGQHQRGAELVCHEVATGRECWRSDLGGKFQRGSLLRVDGAFLCLGENGDLAWLDLSPKAARVISSVKLFDAPETWSPPVLSDRRLFVCQNQPGRGGSKPRLVCYGL